MSLRDMLRAVETALDAVDASAAAPALVDGPKLSLREIRERNQDAINAQVMRRWKVLIPGAHPSGVSHQRLLQLHERAGRDFAADTVQLTQARRSTLRAAFAGLPRLVSQGELEQLDGRVIVRWIVERRLQRGNGDLKMDRLAPSTIIAKARAGKAGEPIGVWTGQWRDAISASARVEFTT